MNDTQKDRYHGDLKPVTRIRHGKGRYVYSNSYFTYEGDWVDGVKHGFGRLTMRDGSCYEGQFEQGEIMGAGEFTYANGGVYKGDFYMGERHGNGSYLSKDGESYQGHWNLNLKEGMGLYRSPYGDVISGSFLQNKPHGECLIKYSNGSTYEGTMQDGKKHNQGILRDDPNQVLYEGQWNQDLKQGVGTIHLLNQNYKYEGEFHNDEATLIANKLNYTILSPLQETIDPNDKKAKDQVVLDPNAIHYEINGTPITLEVMSDNPVQQFTVVYQGPDIEDPVQPTKEEIDELVKNWQKEAKKQKNPPPMPDFSAKKMISAQPVPIIMESGRLLKIELFQKSDDQVRILKVDYRNLILQRREEIQKIKEQMELEAAQAAEQQPVQKATKKEVKKQTKQVKPETTEVDLSIKLFNPDIKEPLVIPNRNAKVLVNDLEYPEDFPPGRYALQVSDASKVIGTFEPVQVELNVYTPGGIELLKKGGKKK